MIIRKSERKKLSVSFKKFSKIYNPIFYIIVALALVNLVSSVSKNDLIAILVSINAIIIASIVKLELKY